MWLQEEVILLLELYYGFPILWDVHSSAYKKRNLRKIYIRKIQEGLSTSISLITVDDIKEKIKNLQDQINRYEHSNTGIFMGDIYYEINTHVHIEMDLYSC